MPANHRCQPSVVRVHGHEPIRILLVEDQTLMRQGLKTILDLEPGLHVVGEASDGEAGVQAALELRPDVMLMDVQLPKCNGVEATAAICAAWSQARVIILTTFDRDDYVFRGVRAGAVAIPQRCPGDAPDRHHPSRACWRGLHSADHCLAPLRELVRPQESPLDALSEREREVLVLLAQGASNRDIAEKLYITEGTVNNHVSNILAKLAG